ncbi:MAG TPA: hypothetical protein ENJ32_07425 [Crenotrichaceae bacterium]|nr:hypothetical protein [Crenotrichaceae bacterium]
MDNEISLKMSLLLDGELSAQETVELWAQIEQDALLAEQWKRYNQVRSVMNSQSPVAARPDLIESVHQALLSEPVLVAPKAQSKSNTSQRNTFVFLRRTGMVAASGILAMMIYGYQQQTQHVVPVSSQPSAVDVMTDNVVADKQPVEIRTQPVHAAASRIYSTAQIPSEQAFNEYLVSHGEYSYSISPQPLMSAARVVSYNTEN